MLGTGSRRQGWTDEERIDNYLVGEAESYPDAVAFDASTPRDAALEAQKMAEMGRLGTGCRILTEDIKVADIDDGVIDSLLAKHPSGPALPFGVNPGPDHGCGPSKGNITDALKSMDTESAPGISGWTIRMLQIAIEVPRVLEFLITTVACIGAGSAKGRDMLCTARLTHLLKPDESLRPIAIGEVLYRLAMKVIMEDKMDEKVLLPNQSGVKSKGGVEPIVAAVEEALDGTLDQEYTHLVSLDAVNAFIAMDRQTIADAVYKHAPQMWRAAKWAYESPSDLVCGGYVIQSRQGVRQGDPAGPALFSCGLRPALEAFIESLGPGRKVIAYLDNVYIFSTDGNALRDAQAFFEGWPKTLKLNARKCKSVSLDEIRENGFKLFGTMVGAKSARRNFLRAATELEKKKMDKLTPLPHQTALLFLRKCLSADLRHLQRSLKTDDIIEEWDALEAQLWEEVKRIWGKKRGEIGGVEGIQDDLIGREATSLPARFGGLGLLSHRDCA